MEDLKEKLKKQLREIERKKYSSFYFNNEYWKEDLPGKTGNRGLSYDDHLHQKRFSYLSNLLIRFFDFKSILDSGCGSTILLNYLRQKGKTCFGFDITNYGFSLLQSSNNLPLLLASLESIPFKNNSVDMVCNFDVLEHIPILDVESSIFELTRVACKYLVVTINLDNPYLYHPTILSRESWEALFLMTGMLEQLKSVETNIQQECKNYYPEYDFFVFKRIR